MKALLRTFGPRLLGALFAGGATWVAAKTQGAITIDPEVAATTVTGVLLSYSGGHRLLSSKFNQGDAAGNRVAVAENEAANVGGTIHVERKSP